MVNKETKICKVCKSTFVPLTKEEKATGICYVCQDLSTSTLTDLNDEQGMMIIKKKIIKNKRSPNIIITPYKPYSKPKYKASVIKSKKKIVKRKNK